jgi:hypothetical protein
MCRVTLRSKLDPSFRYNDDGFRVARSLSACSDHEKELRNGTNTTPTR